MAGQADPPVGDARQHVHQERALPLLHARPQPIRRISLEDRHFGLGDDRPGVVVLIDEMDRRPALRLAGREHGLVNADTVHPRAAELRKECGMRVEDSAAKAAKCLGPEPLHVAGEDDDVDFILDQGLADRGIQRRRLRVRAAGQMVDPDAGASRSVQSAGVTVVADDGDDRRGQRARGAGIDDRLERGPLVGRQHSDLHAHLQQVRECAPWSGAREYSAAPRTR